MSSYLGRNLKTTGLHGDGDNMVKITFLESNGSQRTGEARNGMSVMEVAVQNRVCGIDADCGGACACATCHVYVAPEWMGTVGVPNEMEDDLLDFAIDVRENSRLSCQIRVTEALDGLVVSIPDKQF